MTDDRPIVIATRASELALRQARIVESALDRQGVRAELKTFRTTGDKRLDEPLSAIGGKGLFTKELETALLKGTVDCCVHSLKDLPTESPEGVMIGAVLVREDPRDVLVLNDVIEAEGLHDIPRGSRIGTSSLRRRAQVLALRPDLDVVELRGNVPTRLRKVDEGQVHAAILAAAGLHRLDARQRISAYLEPPAWLPAAGQGAIAVQIRSDDDRMRRLVARLNDEATMIATRAERAFLSALEGGCQVPIGALAIETAEGLVLHGLIAEVTGRHVVRGERAFGEDDPELVGVRLANDLRSRGGTEVLGMLRGMERVPSPQPE
jgi:hydroxymethylbilane synthase